jgi:hypothetical protein
LALNKSKTIRFIIHRFFFPHQTKWVININFFSTIDNFINKWTFFPIDDDEDRLILFSIFTCTTRKSRRRIELITYFIRCMMLFHSRC